MNIPVMITFCGHREVLNEIKLYKKLLDALQGYFSVDDKFSSKLKMVFVCGGYGRFDGLAARALDEMRKRYPYTKFRKTYVSPYLMSAKDKNYEYLFSHYDEIIYLPLENIPPKFAISKRNEWMVNAAEIVIAYVNHSYGGAWATLKYAKRKRRTTVYIKDDE